MNQHQPFPGSMPGEAAGYPSDMPDAAEFSGLYEGAGKKAAAPLKEFMVRNTREKDLLLFTDLAKEKPAESVAETPLKVAIPAFMISELRRAFEIGFLIFVPFLIIDMVIASVLMSMGMMMLPPTVLALPFKVIFFVLVDGWYMLAGSLVNSFK